MLNFSRWETKRNGRKQGFFFTDYLIFYVIHSTIRSCQSWPSHSTDSTENAALLEIQRIEKLRFLKIKIGPKHIQTGPNFQFEFVELDSNHIHLEPIVANPQPIPSHTKRKSQVTMAQTQHTWSSSSRGPSRYQCVAAFYSVLQCFAVWCSAHAPRAPEMPVFGLGLNQ